LIDFVVAICGELVERVKAVIFIPDIYIAPLQVY